MTETETAIVIRAGADGELETRALEAAGIKAVPAAAAGGRRCDMLVIAGSGLSGPGIAALTGLLAPLQCGLGMLKDGGSVVIVCDDPYRADPADVDGSAIRAGLVGLCRGLALEVRDRDIRVNAIGIDADDRPGRVPGLASALRALAGLDATGQLIVTSGAAGIGFARF